MPTVPTLRAGNSALAVSELEDPEQQKPPASLSRQGRAFLGAHPILQSLRGLTCSLTRAHCCLQNERRDGLNQYLREKRKEEETDLGPCLGQCAVIWLSLWLTAPS